MESRNLAEAPTHTQNRNELKVLVLTDLAEICKKVAENPSATEDARQTAGQFVAKFNSLVPYRGEGDVDQKFQAEKLLIRIARFLPEIAAL
jgi:hypothetical protein